MTRTATLRKVFRTTSLRRPLCWWRYRSVGGTDTLVASYPRSGSTWLRFMLSYLLIGESVGFESVNVAMPGVASHLIGRHPDRPVLWQTHERYWGAATRAIYLVRDPRDVCLSYYRYQAARGDEVGSLEDFVQRFVSVGVDGYGSWGDHARFWSTKQVGRSVQIISYEELSRAPRDTLERLAQFADVKSSAATFDEAVTAASISEMRRKAQQEVSLFSGELASSPGSVVGAGRVGSWSGVMNERARLAFLQVADVSARYGYAMAEAAWEPQSG